MNRIPYSRVDCSGNELNLIETVLNSGWLTTASKALELENKISQLTNAKYSFAINSCTSALHLALEALGVSTGDKVLVPTHTFTASAEVIRYLGADPIFLDVDYGTSTLTSQIIEDAIKKHDKIKALIVVHFAGQAAPMLPNKEDKGILEVCQRNNIPIVEDAAHAFPAKDQGVMIGNIGDITCLSFYANKTMTTGEGGMLLTSNESIANRVRLMRLHGINRDAWDRFTSDKPSWEYDILAPGFKYNMPDINAAIGLAQLERVEEFRLRRQHCAEFYMKELSELGAIDLPQIRVPYEDHAWHIFPIILNGNSHISRKQLIEALAEDGIGTSVHYKPLHRMTYYREKYNLKNNDFPVAESLWKGTLSLPIYSLLTDRELHFIVERLKHHLST